MTSLSQYRTTINRILKVVFQVTLCCGWWTASIAFAAPFFASPVRDGELEVKLHPTESLGTGTVSTVTFGVPFPRGSVLPGELGKIRVLNAQRQEVPAFVETLTPWRHATDPAKNETSLRVVRIQFDHAPTVVYPNSESFYVEWGRNSRTRDRPTLSNPRNGWHLVTSGSFVTADGVREPNVYAVLPAHWMARGLLRTGQMEPFDSVVSPVRDSPAVMDATEHYPAYREQQYASKNFFFTAVNDYGNDAPPTPARLDPYRTVDEPWLYDRAAAFYALYFRSGSFRALRESVRASEFYRLQLYPAGTQPSVAVGAFRLKVPNPAGYIGSNGTMYSYGEPLAYSYWVTGDNETVEPIKWVAKAHEDASSEDLQWSPWRPAPVSGPPAYTERHVAFRLMAHVMAYEVFGDGALVIGKNYTYKSRFQEIASNLRWHQDGAGGQIPTNRVDGALWKDGGQQQEGDEGTFVAAAWHYGQLLDAMVRVYGLTEENAVGQFIRRAGTFLKSATKFNASEYDAYDGPLRSVDYVTNINGSTYAPDGASGDHVLQTAGALAWSYYFSVLLGTPDASLKQHANDLYLTYDILVNDLTRPDGPASGFSAFRIGPSRPWRMYNWMYHNSGSLSWALKSGGVSTDCRMDVDASQSLDANVDGIIILRYLLGVRGAGLTSGVTTTGSRNTAQEIETFLAGQDLRATGTAGTPQNAARDGLLIARYMRALTGSALVTGTGIPSTDGVAVEARLAGWCQP